MQGDWFLIKVRHVTNHDTNFSRKITTKMRYGLPIFRWKVGLYLVLGEDLVRWFREMVGSIPVRDPRRPPEVEVLRVDDKVLRKNPSLERLVKEHLNPGEQISALRDVDAPRVLNAVTGGELAELKRRLEEAENTVGELEERLKAAKGEKERLERALEEVDHDARVLTKAFSIFWGIFEKANAGAEPFEALKDVAQEMKSDVDELVKELDRAKLVVEKIKERPRS